MQPRQVLSSSIMHLSLPQQACIPCSTPKCSHFSRSCMVWVCCCIPKPTYCSTLAVTDPGACSRPNSTKSQKPLNSQSTYCSRSKMWSKGQGKGSCREEPGMLPSWGAHHLSMPHHSCGMISVRFRLLAIAMAMRTCNTTTTACYCCCTAHHNTLGAFR